MSRASNGTSGFCGKNNALITISRFVKLESPENCNGGYCLLDLPSRSYFLPGTLLLRKRGQRILKVSSVLHDRPRRVQRRSSPTSPLIFANRNCTVILSAPQEIGFPSFA